MSYLDSFVRIFAFLSLFGRVISGKTKDNSLHVKLEVYIESGCPISQGFLLGELTDVLSLSDIVAITDFKYVAFGNAFYNQTLGTYECFDEVECQTDVTQLCGMYKFDLNSGDGLDVILSGQNSLKAFPFISCMEAAQGLYTSAEGCWNSTMIVSGISSTTWQQIYQCSVDEYLAVMTAGDMATPQELTTVPWVLVDSVRYNISDANLLATICKAYTGTPLPASCQSSD